MASNSIIGEKGLQMQEVWPGQQECLHLDRPSAMPNQSTNYQDTRKKAVNQDNNPTTLLHLTTGTPLTHATSDTLTSVEMGSSAPAPIFLQESDLIPVESHSVPIDGSEDLFASENMISQILQADLSLILE